MYTVTMIDSNTGLNQVSRYFNTKRAALKWAKWLQTKNFVTETAVYLGQAGEELIERKIK
jgi:hypothetical protein